MRTIARISGRRKINMWIAIINNAIKIIIAISNISHTFQPDILYIRIL